MSKRNTSYEGRHRHEWILVSTEDKHHWQGYWPCRQMVCRVCATIRQETTFGTWCYTKRPQMQLDFEEAKQ